MNEPHDRPIPAGLLIGAAALIALAVVFACAARLTGIGATKTPASPQRVMRELRFLDQPDGSIFVYDAGSSRYIGAVAAGGDGFLRGTLRSLVRERRRDGVRSDAPFRIATADGSHLTLEDPATGRRIDLGAFGPTNEQAFARFVAQQAGRPGAWVAAAAAEAGATERTP